MKRSKTKLILSVGGAGFLLLLAVNYMAGELSPQSTALEAALAACRAKGWQDNDVALTSTHISNHYGLGSAATIALKPKDPNRPRIVRVQLRRRINLLGWEVVDYKEE